MDTEDFMHASPMTIQNAEAATDRTSYSRRLVRKLMDSSIIENESVLKSVVGGRTAGMVDATYYENAFNNSSLINNTTLHLDNTRHLIDPETPTSYQRNIYNSINCVPENETGTFATRNLFYDFNQCMMLSSNTENTLKLLYNYEECCFIQEQFLMQIKYKTGSEDQFESIDNMCGVLKNEIRTWRLLSCLYRDKIQEDIINASMQSQNDLVINEDEQKLIDVLFQDNSDVRRAQNVVDWLEKNAAQEIKQNESKFKVFHDSTLWENTLYFLKQNQMKGTSDNTQSIVTEMDPDAPLRQKKSLYNLDKNDEVHLYKHMFAFIRAGKIEQAQEICVDCGQPWRAASLEGWRLYNDPNITCKEMDDGDSVIGNPMRSLWKNTAWHMSTDESLNLYERAIYGVFCGNLKAILNACLSWEDFMWAYFKVLVDLSVEKEVQNPSTSTLHKRVLPQADSKLSQLPNSFWDQVNSVDSAKKIFENLQSSSNDIIQQECNELFHLIQKFIILDDINSIVDTAHAWLETHAKDNLDNAQPHVLRFIIHLILFLNKFGLYMDEEKCNYLIEAYVKHLASHEMTQSLVACYTAELAPDRQVVVYSDFLKSINGKQAQEEFLELAKDAGLNVPKITRRVVQEIKENAISDYSITFNEPSHQEENVLNETAMSAMDTDILPEDQCLINSLDWLIYDPTQRADAIKQCCSLMRSFLIASKFMATKKVFEQIPSNSIEVIYREWKSSNDLPNDVKNSIREYLCLKAYLAAHSAFKEWFVHFYNKKPIEEEIDSENATNEKSFSKKLVAKQREQTYVEQLDSWQKELDEIANKVRDHIYNVLMFPDGGWLVDSESDENDKRSHELSVLRKMCIPTLCDLLVTVYENTGGRVDECLTLCSDITNNEEQLYKLFTKNVGRKLLKRIKDVALNEYE